ncbi:MAG TPA: hypothetical protein VJ972_14645 [Anaerolineales bacterium]|nr:hypothetical protein [Anaerolineales bacterium]
METCFICCKHKGQEPAPPGGYIYARDDSCNDEDAAEFADKLREAMK